MSHYPGILSADVFQTEHTNCYWVLVLNTNRVDGRFRCLRHTNVLLTKLNAGKNAVYL